MNTTIIPTASELARAFVEAGFLPGLPSGLPATVATIDRASARWLRCPGCKRRGMQYRPWFKGGRYRVLARCPHCPCGEER